MPSAQTSKLQTSLLYPLSEFYEAAGLRAPSVVVVTPAEIPAPYRNLLVHHDLMTPTLEGAFGERLKLRTIGLMRRSDVIIRQVLLISEKNEKVYEMGAIRIGLEFLGKECRRSILEGYEPLGSILRRNKVEVKCNPASYFRIERDDFLGETFATELPEYLFGRKVSLTISAARKVADVIELLPNLETTETQTQC